MSTLRTETLKTTDDLFSIDVDQLVSATQLGTKVAIADLANSSDITKGAALVGYSGRNVFQAFRDRVNVADYLGGGATQTQAAQAAAVDALASGKALYFPAGTWVLTAAITGTGSPIAIVGDGVRATRVAFSTAGNGGFSFTFDPQGVGVIPDQFSITDMTIESRAAIGAPAISAVWSTYQPNAQGMAWIENLNITRQADGTGSFTAGILLNRCMGALISRVILVGDEARVSQYGLHFIDCLEVNCTDVKVTRYQEGARIEKVGATQTEGVFFNACWFYDVNRGIHSPHQAIHINAIGSFFNQNGAGASSAIELISAAQCTIMGCLIYVGGTGSDPINQDGIRLTGGSGNTVRNNRFVGVTKVNARYGIVTSSSSDYNDLSANDISFFSTTGIFISDAGSNGNRVLDNNFFDCTAGLSDSGTGTYRNNNTNTALAGNPVIADALKWASSAGTFGSGQVSTNASWGGFIQGYSGSAADLALVDSTGAVAAAVRAGVFAVKAYAKASLPSAGLVNSGSGIIYVTDDVGGSVIAFSDGTNWRRVTDRAIIA